MMGFACSNLHRTLILLTIEMAGRTSRDLHRSYDNRRGGQYGATVSTVVVGNSLSFDQTAVIPSVDDSIPLQNLSDDEIQRPVCVIWDSQTFPMLVPRPPSLLRRKQRGVVRVWFTMSLSRTATPQVRNETKIGVVRCVQIKMALSRQYRMDYYIGIDVGTGSARGGLFTENGRLKNYSSKEIKTWQYPDVAEGSYEQSTSDIWEALRAIVKVCGLDRLRHNAGLGDTRKRDSQSIYNL